jgi:hypothetical protein
MISAAQMAAMQAVVARAFDMACTISRKTLSDDGYGGRTETWNPVTLASTGTAFNCNIDNPSATMLATYADRLGNLKAQKIRVQWNQDIQQGDRITVAGETYLVQVVIQPESYSTSQMALGSELK